MKYRNRIFTLKFFKRLLLVFCLVLLYVAIAATVFHQLEDWTWIDSVYYASATITTVGYGDLAPTHQFTRALGSFFMLTSVPVFFMTIGLMGEALFFQYREVASKEERRRERIRRAARRRRRDK